MSPPDEEAAPGQGAAIPQVIAATDTSLSDRADTDVEPRKGALVRVVASRTVGCYCTGCARWFGSTGPAASHARSARHRVEVDYATEFAFTPVEQMAGAR